MRLYLKTDEESISPGNTLKEVILKRKSPFILRGLYLSLAMVLTSMVGYSQSGKVFRDGNGNGTKQPGERGIAGIQVKSYINNGIGDVLLGSAVSNDSGYYNLTPAATAGQLIRIEFGIPANFCNLSNTIDYPALGGNNYGTNIQFVKGPSDNVNFGIQNPSEYITNPNPTMFVPCYVNGDPLRNDSEVKDIDAFVSFDYNAYGVPGASLPGGGTVPYPNKLATASQIGTTWGVAYSKQAKKVFTSAFLKRHSGMGPLGPGGIYMINPAGGVTNFFSFDALGFPTNASGAYAATYPGFDGVVGSNTDRTLPAGKDSASRDKSAFDQVGKVSLGDIDLSDDGQFLYAINLYDRKLYRVDLKNAAAPVVPTADEIKAFDDSPWLTETCTNGVSRPFGLKYYRGKIYVGVVCTGEDVAITGSNLSKFADDLLARVYELDITGGTWSKVMEIDLDYQKGIVGEKDNPNVRGWYAWTDDFEDLKKPYFADTDGFKGLAHPQPMLSDIEFDQDGSIILAFMDRMGHQVGNRNYAPATIDNTLYYGIIGGDLLRAYKNPTTCNWDLENNGKAGNIETAGKNNGQGIGGGEFYWGDGVYLFGETGVEWHSEVTQGGMAINPSSGEVLIIAMDPVDDKVAGTDKGPAWSGGVARFSNTTGAKSSVGGYNLYTETYNGGDIPQLGKANGLGDVEITAEIPPIQIGNRVWKDLDEDGIQDSDEPGIDGVLIELCNAQGQKIAQTTTSNGGQWYFRTFTSLLNTHPDSLLIETDYIVKIVTTNYAGGVGIGPLEGLKLTKKDQTGSGLADVSDSDADPTQPTAQIAFKTGELGQSMYDLDFGVTCATKPSISAVSATAASCNGITALADGKISATVTNTLKVAYNKGTAFTKSYAQATAFTGGDIIATLANPASAPGDTYYIRFYGSDSSCFKDTTILLPFKDCSCVKPTVTATAKNQAICEGSTVAAFTASTTPSTGLTLKWYGPLSDTTGSLGTAIAVAADANYTPTANFTGKRYFAVVATGDADVCSDTAFVALTINIRPVANATAKKQTICVGDLPSAYTATPSTGVSYAWYGALSDTTGSLGTAIGGATSATFTPSGAAITTPGIKYYAVVVTNTQTTCKDTAFVQLAVNAKPTAGPDFTGGSAICNSVAGINLPNAANGESWSQLGNTPKAVTINAATGEVSGMDAVGTYQFILSNATTDCADTVSVEVKNCLKGSIGDLVWKDVNDNGIQDLPAEKGVQGVIVQLLNSDSNDALLATDTTDASGIYSFNGLDSGNYKVKIVLSSLPDTCQISSKQDVNTGGGNDTNDSDFNPTTGESPVININTLDSGIDKDNPTIDAALITPCIKPVWTVTNAPVCSPNAAVYSVSFTIANKNGNLKVNAGTLAGNNPYTVTGIPNGNNLVITDSLRANCVFDTTVIAPDCSCPQINLLSPNATACIGDTLPTLKITLLGTNTNGVSANWFANASGGSALASGLAFKPAGLITANDTFFVELTGVTGNCIDLPRTAIVVTALNCEIDLALKKSISTKIARIGDTLTYTLKVWNEFTNDASGVEVTDSIATSVQFLNGSFTASRGNAVITGNVIKWTIGNIAAAGVPANGDTVTLTYKVKATQEGVHFNTAEISKTNEEDRDSTPGNGADDEDDLDRQCFTVPVKLCPGEKMQASVPAKYVNVKWFIGGIEITSLAGQNTVLLSEVGNYTFTASNNACPLEGCCPVIIEPGDNCCPEDLCVPFIIKKTKKK